MTAEFLCGSHHLVADNGQMTTFCLQGFECLGDTVIRLGRIERVSHIMLAKGGEGGLKVWIRTTIGDRPFHQLPHPIAHKAAHIVYRVSSHPVRPKGIVYRSRKIA